MNLVDKIAKKQLNPAVPTFQVGDSVRVDVKIKEGAKERIQAFEGDVIAKKGGAVSETFTVRKISGGIGVERTFPVHSPNIVINVTRKGRVRRAKLYFVRDLVSKYKIKERS